MSLIQQMEQMDQMEQDKGSDLNLPTVADSPDPSVSLSPSEQTIIELHLDGHSNIAISKALKCSPANISYFLRKPHVKAFLLDITESEETRLRNLKSKFVDVIAKGLTSEAGIGTQLKAARLYKDATRDIEDNQTAEDVVGNLLDKLNVHVNVQVNNAIEKVEKDK